MREVEVIMYEANDGKLFDTKENCLAHESKEVLKAISETCKCRDDCEGCSFFQKENTSCILCHIPDEWSFYL